MEKPNPTPLYDRHLEAGAKIVPFAGFAMPVQYRSIIAEHLHTRKQASIFDICHMGEFLLRGRGARQELSRILTHNLVTLQPGRCRYGFMLNERGGVLDDLIVYCLGEDEYMLVVNGSRHDADFTWLRNQLSDRIALDDVSAATAKIDLQGPESVQVLERCLQSAFRIPYFSFVRSPFAGFDMLVSRTGYTGELGFELYLSVDAAVDLWNLLLEQPEVEPAGLGARDTLRLEAGLPLYGQDLDEEHTPVEAGYGFMLKSETDYIGKQGLDTVRERLIPLSIEGRRSARPGDPISLSQSSEPVGQVTSGSYAPSLGHSIALGYVQADKADADRYLITGARNQLPAERTELPFYKQGTARKKLS